MQVEAKKSYRTGFVLRESDLRRCVDTIHEQFAKLPNGTASIGTFSVKLRNGIIIDKSDLDEVLSLENGGSSQIVRLSYICKPQGYDDSTLVRIEYINADLDDEAGYRSFSYQVHGGNRDWVFITSSQLEERFEKIKRFCPNQLGTKGPTGLIFRLIFPFIVLLIILATLNSSVSSIDNRPKASLLLQEAVKQGTIKDPVDALIFIEQQRELIKLSHDLIPGKFALISSIILMLLTGLVIFLLRYYPVYSFCWGEYEEEFQRKESKRQFWLVIIIIGVIVSFVGGILANNIGALKAWFAQ